MKLLLDQGLPRTAVQLLDGIGIDSQHVSDVGFSEADDAEILERARFENRVVVTLDADFHALLALSGARGPSVIRLRIEGLEGQELKLILEQTVRQFDEDLQQGAVITIQPGRARIRRLPLIDFGP